jgi:hypothetical protein
MNFPYNFLLLLSLIIEIVASNREVPYGDTPLTFRNSSRLLVSGSSSLLSFLVGIPSEQIPIFNLPNNPFYLEYHMTRYYGGCFHHNPHPVQSPIVPWIRNFQWIIANGGINWEINENGHGGSSVYYWADNDPLQYEHYQHYSLPPAHELRMISVHPDNKHHKFFFDHVLPALEKYSRQNNNAKFILHCGGGDSFPHPNYVKMILDNPLIEKWIIEQNRLDEIIDHPKVVMLPIGICPRENFGELGHDLRRIIRELEVNATSTAERRKRRQLTVGDNNFQRKEVHHNLKQRRLLLQQQQRQLSSSMFHQSEFSSDLHYTKRLLQAIAHSKTIPWEKRSNNIYFCFAAGPYQNRKDILDYAGNYTEEKVKEKEDGFVTFCNGSLTHSDLWLEYTKHKFIFSPHGNGPDCGRTYEIMLLGAVPVIQYFPGALGYSRANFSVILMKNHTEELTKEAHKKWIEQFKDGGTPHEMLTKDWMNNYLFNYQKKQISLEKFNITSVGLP